MQKSFLVIFEVFLRLNSDLLDMISCFVTAVLILPITLIFLLSNKIVIMSRTGWSMCKIEEQTLFCSHCAY